MIRVFKILSGWQGGCPRPDYTSQGYDYHTGFSLYLSFIIQLPCLRGFRNKTVEAAVVCQLVSQDLKILKTLPLYKTTTRNRIFQ